GRDALIFGMIGNFYTAPLKDQFTVCRALPDVLNRFPDAHFVFAGRAEENSDLEKCISFCRSHKIDDRVHFLGGRKDIADILRSLNVFVLSTRHEGLAISAIEAMLVKVPTILSDIAPLMEVSQNGDFAKIFKTHNAEDLAEKMIELAEDEELRKDLASRAYDFAKNTFSIETHIGALKQLYERIVTQ
ncbi:MAG: glycosyltransferase family 4 protein, partial [Pyrinomonadaceae bacterium]